MVVVVVVVVVVVATVVVEPSTEAVVALTVASATEAFVVIPRHKGRPSSGISNTRTLRADAGSTKGAAMHHTMKMATTPPHPSHCWGLSFLIAIMHALQQLLLCALRFVFCASHPRDRRARSRARSNQPRGSTTRIHVANGEEGSNKHNQDEKGPGGELDWAAVENVGCGRKRSFLSSSMA